MRFRIVLFMRIPYLDLCQEFFPTTKPREWKKSGELRGQRQLLVAMLKAWVPFPELISQVPVENPGANLQ